MSRRGKPMIASRSGVCLKGRAIVKLWGPGNSARSRSSLPKWWPEHVPPLILERMTVVDNLVTDDGLEWVADRLSAAPALAAMSHMELGRDGTAPTGTETALLDPIAGSRKALDSGPLAVNNTIEMVGFWDRGEGTDPAIQEAGEFNSAVGGLCLARFVFPAQNKTAEHVLSIERAWTIARP